MHESISEHKPIGCQGEADPSCSGSPGAVTVGYQYDNQLKV